MKRNERTQLDFLIDKVTPTVNKKTVIVCDRIEAACDVVEFLGGIPWNCGRKDPWVKGCYYELGLYIIVMGIHIDISNGDISKNNKYYVSAFTKLLKRKDVGCICWACYKYHIDEWLDHINKFHKKLDDFDAHEEYLLN